MKNSRLFTDTSVAALSIFFGLTVGIFLSPKDDNFLFLLNLAFLWLPQGLIIGMLLLIRAKHVVVTGCAIVLAAYLVAFNAWASTSPPRESLVWLGYLFSLPGAAIGALIAVLAPTPQIAQNSFRRGLFATALTLFGLLINQAVICSTVMYCARP